MSHAPRLAPPVAMVVRWPQSASAAVVKQLEQCVIDGGLAATWAMETPVQAQGIRLPAKANSQTEIAMLTTASRTSDTLCEAVMAGIAEFESAGLSVETLQIAGKLPRDNFSRRLCQVGIRAVVGSGIAGGSSAVTALPFGIWQYSPHLTAPKKRRWFQLFSRRQAEIFETASTRLAVAAVDLGMVPSTSGRAWRAVEALLEQLCEAQDAGAARITTVAQVTAEFTDAASPRPQRSILRAA